MSIELDASTATVTEAAIELTMDEFRDYSQNKAWVDVCKSILV
ncbi:hypothetical protein AGMMS49546_34780 [Spirochaetia bacterium]|nr:hypothetical protein AGMMS49546_34780 [Spirochaetia bacterium]